MKMYCMVGLLLLHIILGLLPAFTLGEKYISVKGPNNGKSIRECPMKVNIPFKFDANGKPLINTRTKVLSLFLPWLYFLCSSMNISTLPRHINAVINKRGSTVSSLSATVYGNMNGLDAFFTFLSVNGIGYLSDYFGRKPFLIYSSIGLGLSFLLCYLAQFPSMFYAAAIIDGLSSCMLSQSQAYLTDLLLISQENHSRDTFSIALSKFQGIAIGLSFLIGVPLGAFLGKWNSYRLPLLISIFICFLNAMLIQLLLPNQCSIIPRDITESQIQHTQYPPKLIPMHWKHINPFGALRLLLRTKSLFYLSLSYLLLQIAQAGVITNWMNYLQYHCQWSMEGSGMTLLMVGIIVGIVPTILVPVLGSMRSIQCTIGIYLLSVLYVGYVAKKTWEIFLGMIGIAMGASSLPMLTGVLTEQVDKKEIGALQGGIETVRSLAMMIGSPLFARYFAHCLSHDTSTGEITTHHFFVLVSLFAIFSLLSVAHISLPSS